MICPNHVSLHDFKSECICHNLNLSLDNIHRASRALFSPDEESLKKLCQQGFEDALQYLRKHHCKYYYDPVS